MENVKIMINHMKTQNKTLNTRIAIKEKYQRKYLDMIRKVESEGLESDSRGMYMNKVKMARMRMEDPAVVILKRKIDKMKEKIQDI
jgi:hypothetical protein